ncbi:cilia- and flagella-associated protein 61 isoform X2 [Cynoglossus semilaevis]|uniref:cilia- and flagella-associated protein 61 isoform X2 n=1 Tax=Cynoglossus semilaevis TaxID=244447 RepID=UPI000D626742|nr:cilia- and flagella-associated protein 61-like isoform X2 [Cynoglossus semilaevis]
METVNVRRSESADAQGISSLICPATVAVFGQVDVMQLLEKANLAVTVVDHRDHILAHASFLDHPVGDVVDAADWESFLQERFRAESCTPLNTLFLHLFVTRSDFAAAGVREILRVVFNSVSELEHLLLISSHHGPLEPALTDTFQPLQPLSSDVQPQCLSFICDRQQHCPRLRLLQARMKDHDGVMSLFDQQRAVLSVSGEVASLTELMQNQDERNHTAVCQVDGVVVGLISATSDVDLKELCDNFELEEFNGLQKKTQATKNSEAAAEEEEEEEEEEGGRFSSQEETEEKPDVFWIKFLLLDSKYEMRSVDLLPYVFQLFPDLDFCVITAPTLSPDFSLLQSFFRARRRPDCSLLYQLYVFHRVGLRPVQVRAAVPEDRPAVCDLVQGQETSESLLQDLDAVFQNHGDLEGVQRQAFVAQVDSQLVGALILRDEENVEFVRAHYNIENFIYFSHHRPDEHAHLLHFTLRPLLQHRSRHLLKETLRLAKRSCLYHRLYQQGEQAPGCEAGLNSSVVKSSSSLELLLDRAVPVRPRRQIVYPLKELGINAPSTRITEEQVRHSEGGH